MVSTVLVSLIVLGWVLVLTMHACQRQLVRDRRPAAATDRPPVSILKPLKGADPGLETNLHSFFRLDYPAYEIVFGVEDAGDPGLEVARRVASRYPELATRFIVDRREVGFNPKVNNLANMARRARNELIVISDSNVAVPTDHLQVLVGELLRPGVGLVTSPVRAQGGTGSGGHLERVQLNTFVMGGIAAVSLLVGRACAMGKTMILRRSDLDRAGGWRMLGRFLAEDQVLAEEIDALGLAVVVSPQPVDHRLGRLTVADFAARHLRWAKLRRHLAPVGYAAELLANPVAAAVLLLAIRPGWLAVGLAVATLAVMSAGSVASGRLLDSRLSLLAAPAMELVRGLLLAMLWPLPFLSSSVSWRGNRLRIGRRTLLQPTGDLDWVAADELEEAEVLSS